MNLTIGRFVHARMGGIVGNPEGTLNNAGMGQLFVKTNDDVFGMLAYARAYAEEFAWDRVIRLSKQEGVPFSFWGPQGESAQIGPQAQKTYLELMQECAEADGGVLYEPRGYRGLAYRARSQIMGQESKLTLDASSGPGEIVNPFAPILDDQAARNDVTMTRDGGSSARATDEADVADRGRYADNVTLNLWSDAQLAAQAAWRVHLGTYPGMRYPSVTPATNLAPELYARTRHVDVADRVVVKGLPRQHPAGEVSLLAQGYAERISPAMWDIELNTTSEDRWAGTQVTGSLTAADPSRAHRVAATGTVLVSGISASSTSILIASDTPWITSGQYPSAFPLNIVVGGEHMTATAITTAAADTFARTVSGSWGTADSGLVWTTSGGSASDYAVSGGTGWMSLGSVNVARTAVLPIDSDDVDAAITVSTPVIAAGNWIQAWVIGRYNAAVGTFYSARVEFKHTGIVGVSMYRNLPGGETFLGGAELGTYSAGQQWRLRMRITGATVQAKLWPAASVEPAGWNLVVRDTAISGSGDLAVLAALTSGNTNTLPVVISFSNLAFPTTQRVTVTRTDGIAHAEGAPVSVHPSSYVVL